MHRHFFSRLSAIAALIALLTPLSAKAQWQKVAQFQGNGSAAYFFNANEGVVGTGSYQHGTALGLYTTSDGGATWSRATLPDQKLFGQVTDIYFTDRLNGWATLKETIEHGWSGLYRSTDGGNTWSQWYQFDFPIGVRQTGSALFVSDRLIGVWRSTDGGLTFQNKGICSGALGIDFLNDNNGYLTAEAAPASQHLGTVDGGSNWTIANQPFEAWTVFADKASGSFFFSSEKDDAGNPLYATIRKSTNGGASFSTVYSASVEDLNGGIAGWRGCSSVVYAQGGPAKTAKGLLRSTDGGQNWTVIGGPTNYDDTRFGVTGRGAVVYAFDAGGGIWKTSNGGDGRLSPSILKLTNIQATGASIISARVCDSATAFLVFQLNACDSVSILSVTPLDDTLNEISINDLKRLRPYSSAFHDTLKITFHAMAVRIQPMHFRVTLRQPDGYQEDTIITQSFQGLQSTARIQFSTLTSPNTVDFGSENICTGDSIREITLTNLGCASAYVSSFNTSGSPFSIISNFRGLTLGAGNQRSYLIQFKPSALGFVTGKLYIRSTLGADSITLTGTGIPGKTGIDLRQPAIVSSLCDSATATIQIHNSSCSPITIDSVTIPQPITLLSSTVQTLSSDSSLSIDVRYAPTAPGAQQITVVVHAHIAGAPLDTTLLLSVTATPAGPVASLDKPSLDFGNVSLCSFGSDSVFVISSGCGIVTLTGVSSDDPHFSAALGAVTSLPPGTRTGIAIRFTPTTVGNASATITIHTNAGDKTVAVSANGISDAGNVTLSVTDTITLACETSTFSINVENTTCDSIWIDSATISGANGQDFQLNPITSIEIGSGNTQNLAGIFMPQGSGLRTGTATIHIRRHDGTRVDQTIALSATSIPTPPIIVAIRNGVLNGAVKSQLTIPVYALNSSVVPVNNLAITLRFNTDLLDPTGFDISGTSIASGTVTMDPLTKGELTINISLPAGAAITTGPLGVLNVTVKVTDTLSTSVTVLNATATNATLAPACLSASAQTDSVIQFVFNASCGDALTSAAMAQHLALAIGDVTPNPTQGEVTMTLSVAPNYQNNGKLEVLDALGHLLSERDLRFISYSPLEYIRIPLAGASGVRYLRVTSSSGVSTRRVILER